MAFSLVASVSATPGANGGATAAINTTGANLLVVSVSWYAGGGATLTVSDSKGNTWVPLTARAPGATGHRFWYVAGPTVGSGHTVTVSGTGFYPVITAYAFAGAHASPFDVETGATTSSASPLATGSITPAGAGALIISGWAGMNGTSNPAVTAGVGLTTSQNPSAGTCVGGAAGYRLQVTAAAINPSWSWTGTDPVAVAVVAFKPAVTTGLLRVQTAQSQASANSLALTFGAPPTVGSAIVVAVNHFSGVAAVSATDNQGNAYTLVATQSGGGTAGASQFVCAALAATGSPFTVTVARADTTGLMAVAIEVGGVGAGLGVDQFVSATGSSTTPASGSTAALTASEVMLVGQAATSGTIFSIAVASATPSWIQEFEAGFTTFCAGEADSRIVSGASGTTPSISWTMGASQSWAALLVAYGPPVTVTVPNVVGLTEAAADTALVAVGLVTGTVTTASHATVPAGDVISQSPTAGSSVAIGSDVNLVVSTGPALTTVPNVVGMTTAAADTALVAVGLVTGTLTTATHPSAAAGTVISQSPTAGSSVAPGSAVALVISLGPLDQSIKPAALVEVELDGVDNGWTALTLDVLRAPGIVIRRGIDETRPDARVASTGTASFGLNNSASNAAGLLGYYSPHHVNLRDGFGLGIRCRVSLQSPDLVWRVQFLGRLDAIDPLPGAHGARQVLVTAVDWLDEAARWRLTPAIGEQIDQSWDAVLTAILAQMPVQPAAISLNGGSETWPYALDTSEISQQTALAEFVNLAHSEYGLIYQRADGTLRAEDRHFRMTTTAAVWTLTDAEFQDLELPSTRDDLLNTIRVTTHPRTVSPEADVVVYDQANTIELAAGETKMLMGSYRDPVTGDPIGATEIQPQVVGTDIVANTLEDGTGTNVSSSIGVVMEVGQSGVRFDVTNGTGAPAFLTTLRLIGKAIYDHGATVHEATDPASISLHGEHALDYDMPYQVRQDVGQAAADYILAKYKDPLAQAHSLTVIARTPELLLQILTRDISDRITLSETVTGADDTYFINAVELTIHAAGHASARYTLTPADDPATLAGYFILDISALDGPDILAPF